MSLSPPTWESVEDAERIVEEDVKYSSLNNAVINDTSNVGDIKDGDKIEVSSSEEQGLLNAVRNASRDDVDDGSEQDYSQADGDYDEPGYMNMSHQGDNNIDGNGNGLCEAADESDSSTQHLISENSVMANEMLSDPRKLVDELMSGREKKFQSDLFDKSCFGSITSSPAASKQKEVNSPPNQKNGKSFISPQSISDFPFPTTPTIKDSSPNWKKKSTTPQSGFSSMRTMSMYSFEENEARESFQNAERLNILGGKLLSLGRNEQAVEVFSHAALCAKSDLMRIKRLIQRSSRRRFASLGSSDSSANSARTPDPEDHHKLMLRIASTIADIFNNTGVAYEMLENYDKAIASCKDALKVYKNTCNRDENTGDDDVDRTLHNIKQMELGRSTLAKRRELHAYASSLAKEALKQDNIADKKCYIDDALNTLRTAIFVERESLGNSHPTVARTLMEIAKLHVEKESFDAAFQEMSQSVRLLRHSLGSNHPDVGRALATLAALFDQRNASTKIGDGEEIVVQNDRENAITLYREALRALRASLGEEHPEVGATYNNIGALFYAEAQYEKALTSFTAARKAYGGGKVSSHNSQAFNTTVEYLAEIILIWHNIGEVHLQKNEPRKALTAYNSALLLLKDSNVRERRTDINLKLELQGLSESGISDESSNFTTSFSLLPRKMNVDFEILTASTLQSMASIQSILGVYGQSIAMYEDALRIRRTRMVNDKKSATTVQNSVEIAHIIESIGGIYELREDLESAMKYYFKALNRYKSFQQIDGPDVALLLGKIGSIHFYMEEYEEAVTTFAESIELFKQHGKGIEFK